MTRPKQDCPPPKSDLCTRTAADLAMLIRDRQVSPVEVMRASLERIEEVQPVLNCFCFTYPDEALDRARAAEEAVMRGQALGPLHGVPIAIKDFTPTRGKTTTRGSVCFKDWVPDFDPVIVERFRAAGAIMVGKTTTPEFAFSSFTRSPLWGDTLNPWDRRRTSGGSSGGSGAAVSSFCVALAEGTDMGGSVRIPAAFCGIVGLKPSLGRIPMDILPTVFDSISHFGPLARTVADAALFLRVAEGPSDADIQSQINPEPLPDPITGDVRDLRIALSADLGFCRVHEDVADNLERVADVLRDAGATVEPVDLDWTPEVVFQWNRLWEVLLAAAFADCLEEHRDGMDPEVVALIEAGLAQDAVSYKRIEHLRTWQWSKLAEVFKTHDALICPTMTMGAPSKDKSDGGYDTVDDEGRLHCLDMTSAFNNVPQCPAMSVPSGFDGQGLPTAAQIVTRRFDDPTAFRIAAAVEAAGLMV